MNIYNIRKKLKANSSEELFGISKEPETLIDIDRLIGSLENSIRWINKYLDKIEAADEDNIFCSLISDLEYEVSNIESQISVLDDLKVHIEKMEEWGDEWRVFSEDLLEESDDSVVIDKLTSKFDNIKLWNKI